MGCLYRRKQKLSDGEYRELPTWWIKYYQGGRPVRESTGTTKETVARRILRTREGDVEHGIPINPKQNRITFEEAAANVLNDYQVNARRSHPEAKRRIELHLQPVFKGKLLTSITTDQIRAFVSARKTAGASNGEINREVALLKRAFSLALEDGQISVKPKIPMLEERNVRTGFFESEQYQAVLQHLPAALRAVITFAYYTGWRILSEILLLQWRHVDLKAGVVRLDTGSTKNGRGRVLPFGDVLPELRTVLEGQWQAAQTQAQRGIICPWVFHRNGERIRDFRKAWKNACKAAGCPGRIPHDFRRTAVRNLERAGVPRSIAMQITGHKTESVYRRYDIVTEADLTDGLRRLAAHGHNSGHNKPSGRASDAERSA
jgi:integrase